MEDFCKALFSILPLDSLTLLCCGHDSLYLPLMVLYHGHNLNIFFLEKCFMTSFGGTSISTEEVHGGRDI